MSDTCPKCGGTVTVLTTSSVCDRCGDRQDTCHGGRILLPPDVRVAELEASMARKDEEIARLEAENNEARRLLATRVEASRLSEANEELARLRKCVEARDAWMGEHCAAYLNGRGYLAYQCSVCAAPLCPKQTHPLEVEG